MEPEVIMEWAAQADRRPGDVVIGSDGRRYSADRLRRSARWSADRGRPVSRVQLARAQVEPTPAQLRAALVAAMGD